MSDRQLRHQLQLLLHYSRTLPLRQAGKTTSRDLSNLSALCQTPRVIFTGWTIPSASCMLPLPLSPIARTRCNSCSHNLAPYTLALFGLRFCSQKNYVGTSRLYSTALHCTASYRIVPVSVCHQLVHHPVQQGQFATGSNQLLQRLAAPWCRSVLLLLLCTFRQAARAQLNISQIMTRHVRYWAL